LVLNNVAQTVIETVRGAHGAYVFVYQRRKKNGSPGEGQPHRVDTMNNAAGGLADRSALAASTSTT